MERNNYKMKKVYIAGKLNDDAVGYIKNVHRMLKTSEEVRKAGFAVFVPALDFVLGMTFGYWEYPDYFDNSQPWLESSDAVFLVPGWETSKGTNMEIERAKEHGIPIFDKLEDMEEYFVMGENNEI